jgi:transposase-like protein
VRHWEATLLVDKLRRRRHGKGSACGRQRRANETYLKVSDRWCYLYRFIDRNAVW